MSLDINRLKDLLNIANESAKHGPALSEIHSSAMDELKKIHDQLAAERIERGKEEAAKAAKIEAERVAKVKAEEEKTEPLAKEREGVVLGNAVDSGPGQPTPGTHHNALETKRIADEEKERLAKEEAANPPLPPTDEPVIERRV